MAYCFPSVHKAQGSVPRNEKYVGFQLSKSFRWIELYLKNSTCMLPPTYLQVFFKAIIHMNKMYHDYHIYTLFLLPHSFLNLPQIIA